MNQENGKTFTVALGNTAHIEQMNNKMHGQYA